MKRIFVGALIIGSCVSMGCLKQSDVCSQTASTAVAPASEITNVQNYVNSKGITATATPSGLYYSISNPGTGASVANMCTTANVTYVGRLTNGTGFDSTATGQAASFQLGNVIAGWQKGLPLIKAGGSIKLIIPPTLGYGGTDIKNASGAVLIPANSILVFDITVLSYQ